MVDKKEVAQFPSLVQTTFIDNARDAPPRFYQRRPRHAPGYRSVNGNEIAVRNMK